MSRFLNNLCEGLVNGSNPKYIGSQPTIEEQVTWQLKKEEEARQALYKECAQRDEARRSQSVSTYTPNYLPSYSAPTSFSTSYSTPSYSAPTSISHLSHLSNLTGLSHSQPISYSTPSYSTSSSTYPSFNCTNYGRVI